MQLSAGAICRLRIVSAWLFTEGLLLWLSVGKPQPQPEHPLPAVHRNGRCSQDDESDALARASDRAAASPALVAHRKQSPLKNDVFTEFMFKQMEVRSRSTSPGCAPPLWSTTCSAVHMQAFLKPMCET